MPHRALYAARNSGAILAQFGRNSGAIRRNYSEAPPPLLRYAAVRWALQYRDTWAEIGSVPGYVIAMFAAAQARDSAQFSAQFGAILLTHHPLSAGAQPVELHQHLARDGGDVQPDELGYEHHTDVEADGALSPHGGQRGVRFGEVAGARVHVCAHPVLDRDGRLIRRRRDRIVPGGSGRARWRRELARLVSVALLVSDHGQRRGRVRMPVEVGAVDGRRRVSKRFSRRRPPRRLPRNRRLPPHHDAGAPQSGAVRRNSAQSGAIL